MSSMILRATAALVLVATGPAARPQAIADFSVERAGSPAIHAATIAEALAAARRSRAQGSGAVVITFPSGLLRLDAPIVLDATDGGTPASPLVLRAAPEGTTVSGATIVAPAGASRVDDPRARTLPGFRFGASEPSPAPMLFVGGARLRPTTWPDEGYRTGWQVETTPAAPLLRSTGAALPPIGGAVLVSGYFGPGWAWDAIPARAEAGGLLLERTPEYGIATTARLRVTGALPAAPGRTSLDATGLRLPSAASAPVELAAAPSLLVLNHAAHVRIEGLVFERAAGTAIRIEESSDVRLTGCTVRDTGKLGIAVSDGQAVTIDHCRITDTGGAAIWLSGGVRPTLLPSGHAITASIIARWGQAMPTFPAMTIWGVGTLVRGNRIAGGGGAAIMLGGNDHRVEGNEIAWAVCEAEDAGAIYMGRDWTQRGMTIAGNYIHDIGGARDVQATGVYLDDQFSGATVARNVFFHAPFGVILGGGRDNRIDANLFASIAKAAVSFDARGTTWARAMSQPGGALATSLARMPYRDALWRQRYPALAALPEDRAAEPVGNALTGNVRIDSQAVWQLTPGYTLDPQADRVLWPERPMRDVLDAADRERAYPVLARLAGLDAAPPWRSVPPGGVTACPR